MLLRLLWAWTCSRFLPVKREVFFDAITCSVARLWVCVKCLETVVTVTDAMWIKLSWIEQASSPPSQHQTVDVTQLQDPHGYSQHSIQVQQIQVTEPSGPGQGSNQVNPDTNSNDWFQIQPSKNTLMTTSSLTVLRSGFKPHFPAAKSGVKPLPADTCDFSSKPQSAEQQYPAGHCAACIYTRKLELSRLPWVKCCN